VHLQYLRLYLDIIVLIDASSNRFGYNRQANWGILGSRPCLSGRHQLSALLGRTVLFSRPQFTPSPSSVIFSPQHLQLFEESESRFSQRSDYDCGDLDKMSSGQRYEDLPYQQFGEDSVPSLDLFADFIGTSIIESSSYELQGDGLAGLPVTQPSSIDMNVFDWNNFEQAGDVVDLPQFDAFAAPQLPTSSPDGFASVFNTSFLGAGLTNFNAESLLDQDVDFQDFSKAASRLESDFSVFQTQQSTSDFLAASDNAAGGRASDANQTEPINVSFFFKPELTRRTVSI